MLLCEFWKSLDFLDFYPPQPFGKMLFLASLGEVFSVGWNAYFWCPKVRLVLKMLLWDFLKIQDFWYFLPTAALILVFAMLLEIHFFGVLRSIQCWEMVLCDFWKIQDFWDFSPMWPFVKISFLGSLVELFSVGRNAFFWCPKVCWVLKNASMWIF